MPICANTVVRSKPLRRRTTALRTRYALIADGVIDDLFDSSADALMAAVVKYGKGGFSIMPAATTSGTMRPWLA
jgi:hypothetical protein